MVQAIIMAGGEGSRLRPLTCDRPKPMVPMVNRPVMEHAVELLKKHGITDIGVTLQYMPQEIIDYFGDGSQFGVNMNYFIEETPLGTAGSVKNSGDFLKDTFIVVSGDALTDFNLSQAIEFHRKQGSIATLVLTPVEIPLEYGVVITGHDGHIRQFLEKPGWGEVFSDTVNTGIYILEPEVLDFIPIGEKFDFSKDLFPMLLEQGKPMFGVSLTGYWCDIGNLKQYQEAQYDAIDGKVSVGISGERHGEKVFSGRNCTIDNSAVITGPVVIGDNCVIGKNAVIGPHVVIGNNCRIYEGASIKRSVLWNGVYIGRKVEIRGAVLCSKVTVKDRASVFEGTVIGDGTILEEDVKVRADTKIWPGKLVERGSVLDTHLIWGAKACKGLFGNHGIAGKVNVNLTAECAAKIGAVYGSTLGSGSKVLLTGDGHNSSQMVKAGIMAGLMSVGAMVLDGGNLIAPIHKHSVKTLGVKGGIHIKSSNSDHEMLNINFSENNGSPISRDKERKIENLFEREDFQRSAKQEVGLSKDVPGLSESYINFLLNTVDSEITRAGRFKIVTSSISQVSEILTDVLNGLGCEVKNLDPVGRTGDYRVMADMVAREVIKSGADMGLVLDQNAESVTLIDEDGNIIDDDHLVALISLGFFEASGAPVIAIPVTASGVIEVLAEEHGGKVIRTKTSPVAFYKETLNPNVKESQGNFNQSVITFDGISTTVRMLEYMARKKASFGEVLKGIPGFHISRKQTDCPWGAKGKVIRKLIEETRDKKVELLDGVKVYHDKGWALVLPDAEEPKYNVYSESSSYEFAEELANLYIDKINYLKSE